MILFWLAIMQLALPGYRTIIEEHEELAFHVEMDDRCIFRRHIDHICKRTCSSDNSNLNEEADDFPPKSYTLIVTNC